MSRTRKVAIGIGAVFGLAVIGSLAGGQPGSSPDPSGSMAVVPTPSPSSTTLATSAPSREATPTATTEASVDPEVAFALYKQVFESSALEFFKTDVADAIESDFFWISSIDRTTYDAAKNLLRYDATIDFESVYANDRNEWQSDTWDLFRTFARDLWVPYMEGLGPGEGFTPDWPRWTPRLRLNGNKGRLVADCPGRVIYAISQREATQETFAKECTIKQ
ncbi:MAG TPA: hypothetical protein VGQ89_06940 [Candidatus Limnocylindrales bacterium]|nr:hypothetical protein [Candidatus Limnocylindrales bacterium]